MTRCPHCGHQEPDDAILCKNCGRNLSDRAPLVAKARAGKSSVVSFLAMAAILAVAYAAKESGTIDRVLSSLTAENEAPSPRPAPARPKPPVETPRQAPTTASVPAAEPAPREVPARPARGPTDRPADTSRAGTRKPDPAAVAPKTPARSGAVPQQPVRAGGNIPAPARTHYVAPAYPAVAQSARVQGIVIIEATIGPAGTVLEAKLLRSIPLLDAAALEAVRQWEFTPTLLNGSPVAVVMTVTVKFTLR